MSYSYGDYYIVIPAGRQFTSWVYMEDRTGDSMDFKLIGSILLIVGTSIGAGMLALPIATAQLGFFGSLILLVSCWCLMTLGAFLILEANLWLPTNSNLISMARATIGPVGQMVAWVTYLLLLYSVICAYISGGSDLLHNLLLAEHINVSRFVSALLFTIVFGSIVYCGIRVVDYTNRGLMFVKLGAYILLVLLLTPMISFDYIIEGDMRELTAATAVMVTVTSFGYATIVPSLRMYFAGDVKKLKVAILVGSFIPLLCYIAWDAAIMGVIPLHGPVSLDHIVNSSNTTSTLVTTLTTMGSNTSVTFFAKIFTSICVLTSFLSCSLCLADFLSDGLKLEKSGGSGFVVHLLVFIPPLIVVSFYPNAFIQALEYAGIYCLILLVLLPIWMVWKGRYQRQFHNGFELKGGKQLLIVMGLVSILMVIRGLIG